MDVDIDIFFVVLLGCKTWPCYGVQFAVKFTPYWVLADVWFYKIPSGEGSTGFLEYQRIVGWRPHFGIQQSVKTTHCFGGPEGTSLHNFSNCMTKTFDVWKKILYDYVYIIILHVYIIILHVYIIIWHEYINILHVYTYILHVYIIKYTCIHNYLACIHIHLAWIHN